MATFTGSLAAARIALDIGASPDYASSRGAWAKPAVEMLEAEDGTTSARIVNRCCAAARALPRRKAKH
eukprot:1426100-Rhodomonas_salina.1